ncbi:extensin-like [Rhagoletis pomonella]|uniref:extensin-like n=1 Tax=Rhagoletis pomonella TaxID=28610 RepID=UPI00177D7D5A|nr:extensin-like [Rhagoletis pomonella]
MTTTPTEYVTTTIAPATTTTIASTAETTMPLNASEPLPTLAAKLVRQRRQHPYTIVRHVVRSTKRGTKSRRRYKYPKYKYGPPSYTVGQPISYYKPIKQYLPEHVPDSPKYSVIDELDLSSHLNSADYEVHPSSGNHYEEQAMDLNFYSHTGNAFQDTPKKVHHIEFSSYDEDKEVPTYAYTSTKTERRKPPRTSYSLPKEHSGGAYEMTSSSSGDSGYEDTPHTFTPPENVYDMHPMSSYERPSSPGGNKFYEYTSSDTGSPSDIHIPATKYGVPDLNIPLQFSPPPQKQPSYHAPKASGRSRYNLYDKKIQNSGYSSSKGAGHHNFAEPPTKTNVEITYSPSYEITLPPSNHKPTPVDSYHPAPGNFAEPPPPPPPKYHPPSKPAHPPVSYQAPELHAPPSFSPPEPPSPPTYQIPESHAPPSYETPESHAPPSYEPPESHEPPTYQVPELDSPPAYQVPDSPAPPSYQAPETPIHPPSGAFEVPEPQPPPLYSAPEEPAQPPTTYETPDPVSQSEYPRPDHVSHQEDLPINSNYMPPAYNYPKSSYEVPIYDPIPFEASSNEEHEAYPPHTFENHHTNGHEQSASSPVPTVNGPAAHEPTSSEEYVAPTSTTKGRRSSQKRKRLRNSTPAVTTTKHILDTPELEEAFEASQRQKNHLGLSNDAEVDESNHVQAQRNKNNEEPNYFLPTISPDTGSENSYVSTAWNPIRIRSASASTPTALPAATATKGQTVSASTVTAIRPKGRRYNAGRTAYRQQYAPTAYTPVGNTGTSTRQTTTLNSGREHDQVAVVTVDKSRSYSYYGGSSSTPSNANEYNLYRMRPHQQRQPTRTPAVTRQSGGSARDSETSPHRTTKSVFETTYFKSPRNEDLEHHLATVVQNLPKNHKLF